jgi:hypothetical protein
VFHRDSDNVGQNLRAVEALIARIPDSCRREVGPVRPRPGGRTHRWANGVCWSGVEGRSIIQFLDEYQTHPAGYRVNTQLLREYVERQLHVDDLGSWTVLIAGGDSERSYEFNGVNVPLVCRSWHGDQFKDEGDRQGSDRFVIRRLVSPRDEAIDLDENQYELAHQKTVEAWKADPARSDDRDPPKGPAGWAVRQTRSKTAGVLIIYPIDPAPDMTREGAQGPPLIGVALSFPGSRNAQKVRYVVNNIYHEQELGESE